MKKILLLLVLLMSLTQPAIAMVCPSSATYQSIAKRQQDAMLYAIHDCKNNVVSYVFGTFHTSNAKILQDIAYVKPYVAKAKQAWFEIDLKAQNDASLQKMMILSKDSKGLKNIIGADYSAKMLKLFQAKNPQFPAAFIERYKPWAAAIMLQVLEIEIDGTVMDDMLQQYALEHKIEMKALETAQDQLNIFDKLSAPEQLTLLQEAIDNYDLMAKLSKQMMAYYAQGDLHHVAMLADEAMRLSDAPVNAKLERQLVHKRNLQMAEKLKPVLSDGVFVAVGALHLSGDTGLLQQFEKAGYSVYGVSSAGKHKHGE